MLVSEFDYHLPPELIAQEPVYPRDHARLMHLLRGENTQGKVALSHHHFYELPDLLRSGDLLVFNDTRVLKARLHGFKILESGERGAKVEALLLRKESSGKWETLLRPSARLRPGTPLVFQSPDESLQVRAQVLERSETGWFIQFENDVRPHLAKLGEVPLPPYITAPLRNEERYQTVYSREEKTHLESAAAPTAGLHFTPELLEKLKQRGIETAFVTLAVGIGTFRPIQVETVEAHTMHEEEFEISPATAQRIRQQKEQGKRVIAVGTTTVRVLESAARSGTIEAGAGRTDIFICPGFKFQAVDALITNFHLPKSSLLVMITAFMEQKLMHKIEASGMAALEQVRYAYREAVAEQYRFFSFGDAMFIE